MLFGMLKYIYMMLWLLLAWFQFKVAVFIAVVASFSSPAGVDKEG